MVGVYSAVLALTIVALSTLGEAGFALDKKNERDLLRCFRRSQNSEGCFGKIRRVKRNIAESEHDLEAAYEYLCAVTDYQNTIKTADDVVRAVLDSGSCSRAYPGIAESWHEFLLPRGKEIRIHPPTWQNRSASRITVGFTADNLTNSHVPGSLKAIDLIISRSRDDEIYGKYALRATIQGPANEQIIVHDTVQATCPSDRRRFFVVGLNNKGLQTVNSWLAEVGTTMEFSISIDARKRITKGTTSQPWHRDRIVDIQPRVSAMVLHFSKKSFAGVSISDGILPQFQARRRRRNAVTMRRQGSDTACHREDYFENFNHVIRPQAEFDIGECVGSCDRALTASADFHLNATNHAMTMILGGLKAPTSGNPDPTVCCIPIKYKTFHCVVIDNRGVMMGTYYENMVTDYCGCR